MNKFFLSFFLPLMAAVFAFTACSESDGVEEEYVDWQATNETYFDNLYTTTKAKIASGDNSWKIYQCWTLDSGQVALHSYDHIIVHVVESGSRNVKPEYNDSPQSRMRRAMCSTSLTKAPSIRTWLCLHSLRSAVWCRASPPPFST